VTVPPARPARSEHLTSREHIESESERPLKRRSCTLRGRSRLGDPNALADVEHHEHDANPDTNTRRRQHADRELVAAVRSIALTVQSIGQRLPGRGLCIVELAAVYGTRPGDILLVLVHNYIASKTTANDGLDYSKFSFLFYCFGVALLILHFVFKNNKLPEFASASKDLSFIALFIYLLYFVVVNLKISKFYHNLNIKLKKIHPFMMAISFPFYGLAHFFIKNKLKEDINLSCIENIK
jgi:hypothetical protein